MLVSIRMRAFSFRDDRRLPGIQTAVYGSIDEAKGVLSGFLKGRG